MRRYTTPTHIYTIPFSSDLIEKVRLIYTQNDSVILIKEVADCHLQGNTVSVELTQEETALFDCKKHYIDIQMRVLTKDGKALVSRPLKVPAEKCLDEGVLE